MADNKNNQTHTDTQKASGVTPDTSLAPIHTTKKKVYKAPKAKKERKKGLPIAVDIFIVLALLAIIAGGYFGIRAIANYFAVSYEQQEISYIPTSAIPVCLFPDTRKAADRRTHKVPIRPSGNAQAPSP